jgi:hypothetical protein
MLFDRDPSHHLNVFFAYALRRLYTINRLQAGRLMILNFKKHREEERCVCLSQCCCCKRLFAFLHSRF